MRSEAGKADLLTWTMLYRQMLKPGTAFDLVRHPYLVDVYNCRSKVAVVYKAAQMGASEYLVSYALHAADQRGATVLYVFPTDTHVSDFSSARVGPAIEASPYLDGIVVEGGAAGGKRGADRVTLKRVRDRFVYLRGGQVGPDGNAPQLKSVDADVLILDEVDEIDRRVPSISQKRLGHSEIAEERWASTPTFTGHGIHAKWLESDQREWFVRCDGCGERQAMTINQVVLEWDQVGRPRRWNGQGDGRAFVGCRRCGHELNRLQRGTWVATQSGREVTGFHLTKLFSPVTNLLDVVRALETTDETRRKETINQDLGEPYTPRGGQLTDEVLDRCRRDYAHGPVQGEKTVMGVDVGKVLHVVIRGPVHVESGERAQRFAGEVDDWGELARMMGRFNVGAVVVDALPETTMARKFQALFAKGVVWLAYYVGQRAGTKRDEPAQWDEANGVVNLDRTRTLDAMFGALTSGECTLPAGAREVRDYYAHLKSPVRVIKDGAGGQKVAVYVESGADHLAHAENYCGAAAMAKRTALGVAKGRVVRVSELF